MRKNNKYILILALLILFHSILNYLVLSIDNTYMIYDESNAYMFSLRIFNIIKSNPINLFYYFMGDISSYPPLMHLASIPYYLLFGTPQDIAAFSNITFFIILILSTYGIGKELFNSKIGLLSAIMVSFFPSVFAFSRVYMVDFPLASMTTLSWYLLLKTNKFTNTKYSLFFGISAALGMLAKFTYFIYVFPYFVFLLIDMLCLSRKNNNRTILNKKKLILSNLILASVLFLTISFYWYFFNLKRIFLFRIDFIEAYISKTSLNYGMIFVIRRFLLIEFMLLKQLGIFFFLIFLFSLVYVILNFKKEEIKYLLLWFSLPILFLSINTFLLFKRYLLPILPVIAIIWSFFVFQIINYINLFINLH